VNRKDGVSVALAVIRPVSRYAHLLDVSAIATRTSAKVFGIESTFNVARAACRVRE
jgi:hypothetical protein